MKKEKLGQIKELIPIAKNLVKSVWDNFCLLKTSSSDLSRVSRKYGSEILCQTVLHLSGVCLEQQNQKCWSRQSNIGKHSDIFGPFRKFILDENNI